MQAILGIALLIGLCWLCGEDRRRFDWKTVAIGLLVQIILCVVLLKVPLVAESLGALNHMVAGIEQATLAGTTFLFGYLGGGDTPFEISRTSAMYLFAFRVLPQVVVFSAIVAVLWYARVLPVIIAGFGWVLQRALKLRGSVATAGAASLFLGMVEAPLVIRAHLASLTRSELFLVMTFGMSTVAGSVMVLYAGVLKPIHVNAVGHILSASLINIVGAIYLARLLVPPDAETSTESVHVTGQFTSLIDAITRGTTDGLQLAMNVGAMLLVFVSGVALINGVFAALGPFDAAVSLQGMLGWVFAPIAWVIGVPWHEADQAGALLGTKLVLNELVAYIDLAAMGTQLSDGTRLIMLYALCGFANFGSLGILLGGLTTMIPERRDEFLRIAPKSLLSGTAATLVTGALVGVLNSF